MRKKRLFFVAAVIAVAVPVLLLSLLRIRMASASVEEDTLAEMYAYPSSDSPEWERASVREKVKMCRIPQETLEKMTEEQLVQAVFDFPFLCDVFLYSTMESGVQCIEKNSDAYAELLKREGAKDALLQKIKQEAALYSMQPEAASELKKDALVILALYQEAILSNMSTEEIESLLAVSPMIDARWHAEKILENK